MREKNNVALIGYGYVGKAYHKVFPDALIYTPHPGPGPEFADKETINRECGLAIVCVPTPMKEVNDKWPEEFRSADISAVVEAVRWLEVPLILIKSTVPPGTTDELVRTTGKRIAFSPEYIGEGKYQVTPWRYMDQSDPRLHGFQIFGGDRATCDAIANWFVKRLGPEKFYYIVSAVEAEIVKYMENCWGAMKVIFAQEFYDLCQKFGASYHRVREGWALDNRVERMHTAVFVGERGFGGKCYPKDLNSIVCAADEVGVDLSLIKAVLRKNRKYAEKSG